MIFDKEQIEEILRIIDFNHTLFTGLNIGIDTLTDEDVILLKDYGIDVDLIKLDYTPYEQEFYFGRLASALGNEVTKDIAYNDFLKYLRRGQYLPLNTREQETLKYIKQKSYGHIKGLGDKVKQTVNGIVIEQDQAVRDEYEKTIKDSLERAVIERDTINSIISEIGHKTGDWGRDLGRIAATEMQFAYEEGRAAQIERDEGKEAKVYKEVYPQACRFCIKFFTTNGIGSEPRVFNLNDLRANGTNIGKKQAEWGPTLGPTHPWCRCMVGRVKKGYVWDEEKKMFVAPKIDKTAPKKGIKISVGDKTFEI